MAAEAELFDSGAYERRLRDLVAIRSTSQDPSHAADLDDYLSLAIVPWLEGIGLECEVHPNPLAGFGPILRAWRMEGEGLPTAINYGHGHTVRGMEASWSPGLDPWALTKVGDRWYGRGTAANKGQHLANLLSLEHVVAHRGGKLGFAAALGGLDTLAINDGAVGLASQPTRSRSRMTR